MFPNESYLPWYTAKMHWASCFIFAWIPFSGIVAALVSRLTNDPALAPALIFVFWLVGIAAQVTIVGRLDQKAKKMQWALKGEIT